jgi:ketosteroid isomerase-like protein
MYKKILLLSSLTLISSLTLPVMAASEKSSTELMLEEYAQEHVIDSFYKAFAAHDAAAMTALYHPDVEFTDPVFGTLRGDTARSMWRMLLEISKGGLAVRHKLVDVSQGQGSAHWDADYNFSATGNFVQNRIDARFEFKDGLIYRHRDSFDLAHWSCMALGVPGCLLGHTPWMQGIIQNQAQKGLEAWMKANPDGGKVR